MLLEIQNLKKEYTRGSRTFAALSEISMSIDASDFICLTGRSGSGKSTLLNIIAGILTPTEGEIIFEGENITAYSDNALSYLRNAKLGFIPQGQSVLDGFSVLDNILLPYRLYGRSGEIEPKAEALLSRVGIGHLRDVLPSRLSGGELRRVSIARSLINDPVLLIADEPTSDLDPITTEDVMTLFSEIHREGTAILMVTHEMDVASYANRHFIMEDGRLRPHTNEERKGKKA
jgi:putative ABC transport system ATP-binding protein